MLSCFAAGYKLVMMYKWDAGARARADRARARDALRRRADAVAGTCSSRPDFARRDTSSLASASAAAARRRRPSWCARVDKSFRARAARHRLRHDRDQRLRPAATPATTTCASRRAAGRAVPIVELRVTDADGTRARAGRGRRDLVPRPEPDPRLLEQARGHRRDDRRRLAAQRRHRPHRRRGLRLRARTAPRTWCCAPARTCTAPRSRPRSTSTRTCYEAAVFGVPHERLGEEVAAALVPKPGQRARRRGAARASSPDGWRRFKMPTRVRDLRASRCRATRPARS